MYKRKNVRPITILQVIGTLDRGGAETFLMNVLRNIDRERFHFIFLCFGDDKFDYEDEAVALGAKICRLPLVRKRSFIKNTTDIIKIIKEEKVDVVHSHIYHDSVFSILAAKLAGVRLRIVHSHNTRADKTNDLLKKVYYAVSKLLLNVLGTEFVACGSDAGIAFFFKTKNFKVIHNGIELDHFMFNRDSREFSRNELKISKDEVVILHVGRFYEQKNHTFLISIFDSVINSNLNSRLLLVGDGPLKESIENMVVSLKLENKVMFLGKRSDMQNLYNAADLLLFPSLFEGLPVTLVEAQANGLRCLVSDTVDLDVQLTGSVEFNSLSKTANQWAIKANSLDLTRTDTRGALTDSPYNIKKSIKDIEMLYTEALSE